MSGDICVLACARSASFDSDFRLELFYLPLPGLAGTGPALSAARAAAGRQADSHSTSVLLRSTSTTCAEVRPLAQDREAHQRLAQALLALGKTPPSFEGWLLGRVANPDPSSRLLESAGAKSASLGPWSEHQGSISDDQPQVWRLPQIREPAQQADTKAADGCATSLTVKVGAGQPCQATAAATLVLMQPDGSLRTVGATSTKL